MYTYSGNIYIYMGSTILQQVLLDVSQVEKVDNYII